MIINNGDIIRFKNSNDRDWVCIHYSNCDMSEREKYNKNNPNHTGFYLFGGLWYEGDPMTDKPYGKCLEQLEKGMFNNIEIVGNIQNDLEKYKNCEKL